MKPWFIYRNHGHGVFGNVQSGALIPDRILYQPLTLESSDGDSSITATPVGSAQGIFDLDGDGAIDGVFSPAFPSNSWMTFVNDGTGQFVGSSTQSPLVFITPTNASVMESTGDYESSYQKQGLVDVNGDGLVDRWTSPDLNSQAQVYLNIGLGFSLGIAIPRPGNDAVSRPDGSISDGKGRVWVTNGIRQDRNRAIDIDGDGRVDIFSLANTTTAVCPEPTAGATYYNQGGGYLLLISNSSPVVQSLAHTIAANNVGEWSLRSDFVDLDGDGIPEAYDQGCSEDLPGQLTVSKAPVGTSPPRLLSSIDNGRGATSTVQYAAVTNHAVVEQHPELGVTMPHTRWMVQSIVTSDRFSSTTATTSYFYKSPRFLADDYGDYAMRGFDEIDTTLPTGATSVRLYDFTLDWSGRVVESYVRPATSESTTDVRSIQKTTWESRQLFNGSITTYHPLVSEHFVCKNGQNLAACTASSAAAYTRTTSTLSACSSTMASGTCDSATQASASSQTWVETKSLLQSGTAAANGDRASETSYAVWSDGGTYRVREQLSAKSVQTAPGSFTVYARTGRNWNTELNTAYSVPVADLTWFDTASTTCATTTPSCAVTKHVYDMSTGNQTEQWKPMQNSANTARRQFAYDQVRLYPVAEIDEKGLEWDYIHEYGTGALLQTSGPNIRTCTTNCPSDQLHPNKQTHKIRVDGLGRPIEIWDTISDDGTIYTLIKTGSSVYVDSLVSPTSPTSITSQSLIVSDDPMQTKSKMELDGVGRTLRRTVYAQGSAPADDVTTYHYGNDGALASVTLPDPSSNDASVVSYTYASDSLGRATTIRRPDSTVAASRSGVDISYDGVAKTVTEVVGAAGGNASRTITKTDSFGRLSEVDERTASGPDSFAVTRYAYDPNDNVSSVIDPENVATTMSHDFAGRRTLITRGGRSWKYTYDKNGNLVSEQVPGSPNPPTTDINFTTTFAYDDDDRQTSRVIGKRSLTSGDVALFGADHETLTWDYVGGNRRNQIAFWSAFAPGAGTAVASGTYAYDAMGHRWVTNQGFNITGFSNLNREVYEYKTLGGAPWKTNYWDNVGGANSTTSHVYFDARGLPSKIALTRPGLPNQDLAVQTRNVAGVVTKRRTDFSGPMTYVESDWTYDKLGRVAGQVVQKGPGTVQVARQDLSYFGNDDPATMDQWLGASNHKQFHYGYDQRHQLKAVSDSLQSSLSAQYAFGNAGRFTSAAVAAAALPGSEVKTRNVTYHYDDSDKERLTSLTNVSGGSSYSSYMYDSAGNVVHREYSASGESLDLTYDGLDRLRRVARKINGVPQGTEEYWYDSDGKRTQVLKRDPSGASTELAWFVGQTEAHYSGSAVLQHVYAHQTLGTPVARTDRSSQSAVSLELMFHGLGDGTLAAVDQSGTVNASFSYTPFGEVLETTNAGASGGAGADVHRRRFNDKYADETSGLLYYGARYYDPLSSCWTQSDPKYRFTPDEVHRTPRQANLYVMGLNNPLRYRDPDGREAVTADELQAAVAAVDTAVAIISAAPVAVTAIAVAVTAGVVLSDAWDATADVPGNHVVNTAVLLGGNTLSLEIARQSVQGDGPSPTDQDGPKIPPARQDDDALEAGRRGGGGKGERNWERKNPNTDGKPDTWRRNRDGTYQKRDSQNQWGNRQKGPPPPGAHIIDNYKPTPQAGGSGAGSGNSFAPADADMDGHVTDDEESDWMRRQQ